MMPPRSFLETVLHVCVCHVHILQNLKFNKIYSSSSVVSSVPSCRAKVLVARVVCLCVSKIRMHIAPLVIWENTYVLYLYKKHHYFFHLLLHCSDGIIELHEVLLHLRHCLRRIQEAFNLL
jgi:hypothetical protein